MSPSLLARTEGWTPALRLAKLKALIRVVMVFYRSAVAQAEVPTKKSRVCSMASKSTFALSAALGMV